MRQHALVPGLALVVLIGGTTSAAAQTCNGLPAIGQNSKGNIGGTLTVGNRFVDVTAERSSTVGVGANVTYGSNHLYGTFSLGKTNYTLFEFTTTVVGFELGGQVAIGQTRPISICPFARVLGEWAGNVDGAGLDFSTDRGGGGASVGFALGSSDRREMIPTIGISIEQYRETASVPSTGVTPGTRLTSRSTIGLFSAGIGFVFDKRIALRPAVSYPFGLPGARVGLSLIATVAYGRR